MRPVYVFTDLDNTLFRAHAHCADTAAREAARDRDGRPLSWHTAEQLALLELLGDATLIPVTGRNLTSLKRVDSPAFPWLRITSHGALVLDPDGRLLPSWERQLPADPDAWSARLDEAHAHVTERIAAERLSVRAEIVHDLDMPVYVSIKGDGADIERVACICAAIWHDGTIHRNGRDLALLPPFACKARAVAHVMQRAREQAEMPPLFIGIGDSLGDIPFLTLCHFALTPRASQIQHRTWALNRGQAWP